MDVRIQDMDTVLDRFSDYVKNAGRNWRTMRWSINKCRCLAVVLVALLSVVPAAKAPPKVKF